MATAPTVFLGFLAEHTSLVLALFERGEVEEAELIALIGRHRGEGAPTVEHVRRQLDELGILERSAHADTVSELTRPVVDLLAWLTRRQRLSSATVLRAYLDELATLGREIAEAVEHGDAGAAARGLRELDGSVERVRALSRANRESIVTEAQALRALGPGISAVDRFQAVRRLWFQHLQPLRELVAVNGEMDRRLDSLHGLLSAGENTFLAHGPVSRGFTRAVARLARMRRDAAADHQSAVAEIAPLYEKLRRDSRWVLGASRALERIRAGGTTALGIDGRVGLTGWRTRSLLSDDHLRARLTGLLGYTPADPPTLAPPPPPPQVPLIPRDRLREILRAQAPVDDVLGLLLREWPDQPLVSHLRAFGHVASGAFGTPSVRTDVGVRTYVLATGTVEAWPLALDEVLR